MKDQHFSKKNINNIPSYFEISKAGTIDVLTSLIPFLVISPLMFSLFRTNTTENILIFKVVSIVIALFCLTYYLIRPFFLHPIKRKTYGLKKTKIFLSDKNKKEFAPFYRILFAQMFLAAMFFAVMFFAVYPLIIINFLFIFINNNKQTLAQKICGVHPTKEKMKEELEK